MPTISLEALFSILIINVPEGRDVAIFDVPATYFDADMPGENFTILKIEGEFVDIMCEVNPEHNKCMYVKWGKINIPNIIERIL